MDELIRNLLKMFEGMDEHKLDLFQQWVKDDKNIEKLKELTAPFDTKEVKPTSLSKEELSKAGLLVLTLSEALDSLPIRQAIQLKKAVQLLKLHSAIIQLTKHVSPSAQLEALQEVGLSEDDDTEVINQGDVKSLAAIDLSSTKPDVDKQIGSSSVFVSETQGPRDAQEDSYAAGQMPELKGLRAFEIEHILQLTAKELHRRHIREKIFTSGSTMSGVIIHGHRIYNVNVGDSAAFVAIRKKNGHVVVKALTERLHDPNSLEEQKRLRKAGTDVVKTYFTINGQKHYAGLRVAGQLSLTRAYGDKDSFHFIEKEYKSVVRSNDEKITRHWQDGYFCEADVVSAEVKLEEGDEAVIFNMCDGALEAVAKNSGDKNPIPICEKYLQTTLQAIWKPESKPLALATALRNKATTDKSSDNITILATKFEELDDQDPKYFIVCDGHGGAEVAEIIALNFSPELRHQAELQHGLGFKVIRDTLNAIVVQFDNIKTVEELDDAVKFIEKLIRGAKQDFYTIEELQSILVVMMELEKSMVKINSTEVKEEIHRTIGHFTGELRRLISLKSQIKQIEASVSPALFSAISDKKQKSYLLSDMDRHADADPLQRAKKFIEHAQDMKNAPKIFDCDYKLVGLELLKLLDTEDYLAHMANCVAYASTMSEPGHKHLRDILKACDIRDRLLVTMDKMLFELSKDKKLNAELIKIMINVRSNVKKSSTYLEIVKTNEQVISKLQHLKVPSSLVKIMDFQNWEPLKKKPLGSRRM